MAASDLRARAERTADHGSRRIAPPERAARHESQQARLVGVSITGEHEPGHRSIPCSRPGTGLWRVCHRPAPLPLTKSDTTHTTGACDTDSAPKTGRQRRHTAGAAAIHVARGTTTAALPLAVSSG
jgi:hypothetical protein